jgi:phage terminase small subunit
MPTKGRRATTDLDPREARFVSIYCENPNATRAYVASGFTTNVKSAGVQGHRLLKKPKIRAAIAQRQAQFLQRYEVTQERIIAEFARLAFSNIADFTQLQLDGSLRVNFNTATRDQLAALASIDEVLDSEGRRSNRFRVHDKRGALIELARLMALYPPLRTEIAGADGGPVAHSHKIDIESLDAGQRQQLRSLLLALKSKEVEAETPHETG